MEKLHRASLTIKQLRDECQFIQGLEHKLVHLQGANVEMPVNDQNHFNKGDYTSVDGDFSKVPELVFKAIDGPGDIVIAQGERQAKGGYFIFHEKLYIEDVEQEVYGYGIV